ncbi:MAG: outer membrane beta-barrel domain-containing protein [Desulfobacteraceae bacterium]|nr:MAG: outer membrane beta-barrel domain-containing protein [Desulfobacteraceae bacterium]
MNLLKSFIFVCLMICLVCIAQTASAEIRPGAMTLSPSIGGYFFDEDQDIDSAPVYGLGLGYHFDMHWATEAVLQYVNTENDFAPYHDVNAYLYHIDGLYHFMPSKKIVPFIAAGVGGITIDPENMSSDTNVAINYGAGLKYFVTENFALRGDVRHIIAFNDTENNFLYTVGASILLGNEKAKTPLQVVAPPDVSPPDKVEKAIILATEPEIEEKVQTAAAKQKNIILAFEDVHFDFGTSTLKPEARAILKRNVQILKDNPKAEIRIAGYTSASGTDDYNQKLSERRAAEVREYLINEGIVESNRLSTIGYGEEKPFMYEAAPKKIYSNAAKANMRVLFEIVVK